MKKFVQLAIGTAVIIYLIKSYHEYKVEYQEGLVQPTAVDTYSMPIYVVQQIEEESITIYNDYNSIDYNYVNDVVYRSLLQAQNHFTQLYSGGEVSFQMRNHGAILIPNDAPVIDSNMRNLYSLISQYVDSYQKRDFIRCDQIGKELSNHNTLSREYLYSLLIARKLPREFQSEIVSYDGVGNVQLKNGRLIHFIGGADSLINSNTYSDDYSKMMGTCEWLQSLPSLILNEYSVIQNRRGNDGICYVWNQTAVERDCRAEWEMIRNDGVSLYGFDPNTVSVYWDMDLSTYVFIDSYGRKYPMDRDHATRVDHLMEVQDSMVSKVGDVYFLDSYIKNMRTYQNPYQYTK